MTVRKQYPARSYETFADGDDAVNQSPASYQQGGDADKSRSAAAEARRLASQGSWADSFGGTPATDRTPLASTVDGDEQRDVRYPETQDGDPSDPPPVYTPSVSTQVASQSPVTPASPVAARSFPVQEPVSAPNTESPSRPQPSQSSYRGTEEEEGPSSLPEPVQHDHEAQEHPQDEDEDSDTLPVFLQRQRRHKMPWCRGSRKPRSCGGRWRGAGHHKHDKHRARRFKKICFFMLALLACLWLLIPGLCKSLKNVQEPFPLDNRYQLPNFGKQPPNESWPPEKREHREHETYRSISGTYQLYDLLDLSTTSGSITVTIEVQPGTKPAVLRLASTAGSVHVRMTSGGGLFKKSFISDAARSRVVKSDISTSAGSVSGDIVHGNGGSAAIATNAGSINLSIYTVGVSELDAQSNLSTVTNQGSQHIKVYSGVTNTEPIRAMSASHTVRGSGSMNIDYPNEWEGTVHVTGYGSGSIGASGRGLVVRKESSHELYGYKGSKEGRKIEISEIGSGSVRFSC